MRVAHADDSALFRSGLAMLLQAAGVEVVAQTRTADELLARLPQLAVDVAILDIRMPPTFTDEGLVCAKAIRDTFPGVAVLVLSTYVETAHAFDLLAHESTGVGYLLKDRVDNVGDLLDALERVARREVVIDPQVVTVLLGRHVNRSVLTKLTDREQTVLEHMGQGRSNEGIATQLHLSIKTVEKNIAQIFDRLDLVSDAQDNRRVLAVLTLLRASTP